MYFQDIYNILLEVKILYSKGAAKIKHLNSLSNYLKELQRKIGQQLFNNPNMDVTPKIITT